MAPNGSWYVSNKDEYILEMTILELNFQLSNNAAPSPYMCIIIAQQYKLDTAEQT